MSKALPGVSAIQLGRLVELLIDRLQAGEKDQHLKTGTLPGRHDGDRRQGECLLP